MTTTPCTPKHLVDCVRKAFVSEIELDPCGHPESVVGATRTYYLPEEDGLALPWEGYAYVNPPWGWDFNDDGGSVSAWLARCERRERADKWLRRPRTIAYVPAAAHTAYWRRLVLPAATAVCFAQETAELVRAGVVVGTVGAAFIHYGPDEWIFARAFHDVGPIFLPA
jgi:hypothetical protein